MTIKLEPNSYTTLAVLMLALMTVALIAALIAIWQGSMGTGTEVRVDVQRDVDGAYVDVVVPPRHAATVLCVWGGYTLASVERDIDNPTQFASRKRVRIESDFHAPPRADDILCAWSWTDMDLTFANIERLHNRTTSKGFKQLSEAYSWSPRRFGE